MSNGGARVGSSFGHASKRGTVWRRQMTREASLSELASRRRLEPLKLSRWGRKVDGTAETVPEPYQQIFDPMKQEITILIRSKMIQCINMITGSSHPVVFCSFLGISWKTSKSILMAPCNAKLIFWIRLSSKVCF